VSDPLDDTIRSLSYDSRRGHVMGPGPYPRDVWLSLAIEPTARAGRTWVADEPRGAFEPRPDACAADVHPPPCTVDLYFARPWQPIQGRSHRVPRIETGASWVGVPDPALMGTCSRLLAAVESGSAPMGPMPPPRYHGRPGPLPVVVPTLPIIPELVDGAARRETIDRMAALIRGTAELAALLATAPPDVAARGRAALAKVTSK
jgi:hypothetical protein